MNVQPGDVFDLNGRIVFSRGDMAKIKTKRIQLGQFGVHYVAPEEIEGRDIQPGEVAIVDEQFADNMIASNRAVETDKPVGLPKAPKPRRGAAASSGGAIETRDPDTETRDPVEE